MNKDYHSVILSRAKNLENNSVCIQILHYVQDDIALIIRLMLLPHKEATNRKAKRINKFPKKRKARPLEKSGF